MLYAIFGGYTLYQTDEEYNKIYSAFYIGFYRFFWALGLVWIIIACITGNGGSRTFYIYVYVCEVIFINGSIRGVCIFGLRQFQGQLSFILFDLTTSNILVYLKKEKKKVLYNLP